MTAPISADRLLALRAILRDQELDGFILPRGDEHLGEYVAPYAERLAWLTGFTGSAGVAIVLSDEAALFSDGRYQLQLATQVDGDCYQRLHSVQRPPDGWLADAVRLAVPGRDARIGYDPWLLSEDALARYRKPGLLLVPLSSNPVDVIWVDRPAPPAAAAVPHPLELAGVGSGEKRQQVAAVLRAAGEDAAVIGDPTSIAWAFNLRGGDIAHLPVALGFAILDADGTATLFMDAGKLPPETRAWLGNGVRVEPPDALPASLAALSGRTVRVDPSGTATWFAQTLRAAGATVSAAPDPCLLPKARKNPVEQAGTRDAHHQDGIAVCGFLHWLSEQGLGRSETELSEQLDGFRRRRPSYRGESFPAISGAGPNGAIMHYRADPATARRLGPNEVYLIDSGGQYPNGTTDITRTIWSGPGPVPDAIRDQATRVLQGHVALARARFPAGVQGHRLDALARLPLWQAGLDYDHGTGHGVGSFLSVHEGPCRIASMPTLGPIEAGMILSDEPGFYLPGAYGMRIENLLLAREAAVAGSAPFLEFETLTLAPYDRRLIDPILLTAAEREWIDAYHARVLGTVGPALSGPVLDWLAEACAPLGAPPDA